MIGPLGARKEISHAHVGNLRPSWLDAHQAARCVMVHDGRVVRSVRPKTRARLPPPMTLQPQPGARMICRRKVKGGLRPT